jgi:hypothetical protein
VIAKLRTNLNAQPGAPALNGVRGKHSGLRSREYPRPTAPGHQPPLGRIVPEPHSLADDTPGKLAGDLLRGADEIAEFIFGDRENRRKVYYLAECCRLPVFRLGSMLCARRSVLLNWIAGQESRASPSAG